MYFLLDKNVGGEGDHDEGNNSDGANGATKLPVLACPTVLLLASITCSV